MAEMDNKILIAIFAAIGGTYAWLIKHLMNSKNIVTYEEFSKHKEAVQYKDNCNEIVERIESKIESTAEIQNIKLDQIKTLIENG